MLRCQNAISVILCDVLFLAFICASWFAILCSVLVATPISTINNVTEQFARGESTPLEGLYFVQYVLEPSCTSPRAH